MRLNKYFISFIGCSNTYTVMALNEVEAWNKALQVSGLSNIKGHIELLITRRLK